MTATQTRIITMCDLGSQQYADDCAHHYLRESSRHVAHLPTIHSSSLPTEEHVLSFDTRVQAREDPQIALRRRHHDVDRAPTAGKLQKKHSHKGLCLGGLPQDGSSTDSVSNGSYTPLELTDNEVPFSSSHVSPSKSKDNIVKCFGRNGRDKENPSVIDLSLSMEENERRLGMAISSKPHTHRHTRSFSDHRHHRSFSNGSTPGAPHRSSFSTVRTESAIDEGGYDNDYRSMSRLKQPSYASYSGYNEEANHEGAAKRRRPSLPFNRNRSNTYDETMSRSNASTDHLNDHRFSFKRARTFSNKNMPPMDPETRRLAIELARREWRARQDAKERKYEEQERKAQEKRDRKLQKQQNKKRKKSTASIHAHARSTSPPKVGYNTSDVAFGPAIPTCKDEDAPEVYGKFARRLQGNRSSKDEEAGIFKWCKVHLLHL